MEYKDYLDLYEILEIELGASKEEIKAAYKAKAKQFHPDKFSNTAEKKVAEHKFKAIKEAYDYLILVSEVYDEEVILDDGIFGDFFKYHDNEAGTPSDDINHSNDFFKYYTYEKAKQSKANKNNKHDDLKAEATFFFKNYIKVNKIDMIFVYECVRTNKSISKLDPNIENLEEFNDLLLKEVFYRRHLKETMKYKTYLDHISFHKNLDITTTLKIDGNYNKKKFDEIVFYEMKKICQSCRGAGCNKCKKGIITKLKQKNIKINLENFKPQIIIEEAGNTSPIKTGNLIINIIYEPNSKKLEKGFYFKQCTNMSGVTEAIVKSINFSTEKISLLFNLIKDNKHLSVLYFLIVLMIVVIICLGVLL
ncbi:MAG: J domain-containing protein [Mycoplasma sp.]